LIEVNYASNSEMCFDSLVLPETLVVPRLPEIPRPPGRGKGFIGPDEGCRSVGRSPE